MYQNQLIGQTTGQNFNPYLSPKAQSRASGVITEYQLDSERNLILKIGV